MEQVKTNSAKAWLLAARPKTLSGASVPVMIGAAMAWHDAMAGFQWIAALLCFLFAFVMQIDYLACHAVWNFLYHVVGLPHRPSFDLFWWMETDMGRYCVRGILFPLYHVSFLLWLGRRIGLGVLWHHSSLSYLLCLHAR